MRWRLPGTPLCCSISSTNMAHIYTIACTPPLPPQFLYRIESDDLARVEEVLRFLHRKEAVPVLSAQVWEEIMAAIATRAKDTQEALRIVSLLAERDWRSFLEEYHATVAPDEDEDSAR